jgi:hypothetical protein
MGRKILTASIVLAGIFGVTLHMASAQSNSPRWSAPNQLSSDSAQSSEGYMVSDQYGYLHIFWKETELSSRRSSIQYSRFDGEKWLPALDIYYSPPDAGIDFIDPFVDQEGTIHLIWPMFNTGPILYSQAPVYDAYSARNWSKPITIDVPAFSAKLLVDSSGVIHIFYSNYYWKNPGVYYIRSEDQGITWTSALHLDPDKPDDLLPMYVSFEIDDHDGLHILWYYVDPTNTMIQWIRYARSMDGGNTWSEPITIDRADEGIDELRAAFPSLVVNGQTVQVIWAGDDDLHREYRYSEDGGQSWSQTTRFMGELVGQALGGGLAADAVNQIHYTAQVRYPMGIYHAYWADGNWSIPTLIYFIQASSEDSKGDRIHAHNVRLAVLNGNQLVVTFTTAPEDPQYKLYEIHTTLDEVSEIMPVPTPTPVDVSQSTSVVPSEIETTALPTSEISLQNGTQPAASFNSEPVNYRPANGIYWGLFTSLAIIVFIIFFRLFNRR